MKPNRIKIGDIWEAVPEEPKHFYEILNDEEVLNLRRLHDGVRVTRFRGQVTGFGVIRARRKNE